MWWLSFTIGLSIKFVPATVCNNYPEVVLYHYTCFWPSWIKCKERANSTRRSLKVALESNIVSVCLRNKTFNVPVFYRIINYGYEVGCEWFNYTHPNEYLDFTFNLNWNVVRLCRNIWTHYPYNQHHCFPFCDMSLLYIQNGINVKVIIDENYFCI